MREIGTWLPGCGQSMAARYDGASAASPVWITKHNSLKNNWLTKTHKEQGFVEPLKSYSPAIGISEVVSLRKENKINLYVASLRAGSIYILEMSENLKKILREERLFFKEQRIRDLKYDEELDLFFAIFSYTPSIAVIKNLN